MDSKAGPENAKRTSGKLIRTAGLAFSLLAAGHASAAVPAAAKRPEGSFLPPITGSEKSGAESRLKEDLTGAKEKWVQKTFEESLKHAYGGTEALVERVDPLGDKWIFFKVLFKDVNQVNLIGCQVDSNLCLNLKLPLDPTDVDPAHRGFMEEAANAAIILSHVYESTPDPETGKKWLAISIVRAGKGGIFLLIRPEIMLDNPIAPPSERLLGK